MNNIEEFRIGNFIVDKAAKKIVEVRGISDEGYIIYKDITGSKKIHIENVEPLYLKDSLQEQLLKFGIIAEDFNNENIYFFPHSGSSTYFLVYDVNKDDYFMGMTDINLPEKYRRLTRPFYEYHKLQNAYKTIFDTELKKINI